MREKGLCSIRRVKGDNTSQRVHCFHDLIHHRRLHRKPRNIYLLGIIVSYLTFFVPPIIELIYWALCIRTILFARRIRRRFRRTPRSSLAEHVVGSDWQICRHQLSVVASREDDGSFRVRRHTGLTGFRTVNKAKVLSISIIGA
jgi:hypothetical protein